MQRSRNPSSRRGFVTGTATLGAAAAAASALPFVEAARQPAAKPQVAPEKGGGYHLSEHVKRYYKTTLV